jgi:subtilisin-like proprotein convertase family protein
MFVSKYKLLILLVLLTSCLGGEESSKKKSTPTDKYSPAGPVTLTGDIEVMEGIPMTAFDGPSLLSLGAGTYTYSMVNKPSWMSVDSSTGQITGTPASRPSNGYVSATFKAVRSGDGAEFTEDITIAINGDPLRLYSWHLNNTGQDAFASTGGVSGYDINVDGVFADGITGAGVKVAVSDSGLETQHDDLYQNVLSGQNRNYTLPSPFIGDPVTSSAHGTAVSGIIAAKGWNNIGGMGVAPGASIAGFQFLDSPQTSSMLISQASGDFDIFNYSYGDTVYYDTISDPDYVDHLRYQVKNGRGGKGSFYIKAAGNEFILADDYDDPNYCVSHNANFPFENESPFMMVVGSVNADGEKASYSNAGSNIWISATGGEYGITDPAIISTDLPTCFKGYAKATSGLYNDFEYGHSLNPKCNYTSTMNGTSSAAPVLSGVVALILEANSSLSWRDVKHILAVTADSSIDSGSSAWPNGTNHPSTGLSKCPSLTLSSHDYELGWVTNRAGYKFNNFYGFGLVDAEAAVTLAKNTASDPKGWLPLPAFSELNEDFTNPTYDSGVISASIPDNSATGVTDSIIVSSTGMNVESVQVQVQVTHPKSGQLGIELTGPGPSATTSILMNINNSFLLGDDANLNIVLTSHAFYGESADGTWTIKVIDGASGSSGTLTRWKLNILGH